MVIDRYIADEMLIRLARWLRMAGQDVSPPPDGSDDSGLIEVALKEGRVLLTRDRHLARRCEKAGARCILVRSSQLDDQLLQMKEAGLSLALSTVRCTLCNGILEEVEGSDLSGSTKPEEATAWRCKVCGKIYWRGSHWHRIRERLDDKEL
ncbi:Mut7-C RNAse domain-containing protein [Candidatus Methanocrinis natronophilus]|uniref:Mut7-C RNAse domain-containing protein n=1 Tax=Candidatus Methanocrinis natronophilus TaxID=3033396 RepID=A0ABT5X5I5_9EURY|nr:Mut7-C RNAse domain-containing protein [Candidatus Methanocrinis natronophilus]MDF0589949.1 Mut7-C RNAse domain-containing protein [Candidatus Methanocrinis natronophilus]